MEWQQLSCKKAQQLPAHSHHTAHVGHGLRCWIWIAFLGGGHDGPWGSQGLFKSPWILLNSPNFCNFVVAFATAMSTLLLGDCPYIIIYNIYIYRCTVLRWQDWKLSLACKHHSWRGLESRSTGMLGSNWEKRREQQTAQQILAENRTSADLGRAAYLPTWLAKCIYCKWIVASVPNQALLPPSLGQL